ncbi:hypothetical protein K402DRAFT_19390 [Aulographum hederae CBS 113979]|uniref:Uncharacterized protein n=1 Tax=Aulographum hederae CBS 113979 TaxID=1176131 RepID=A0A6G1H6B2_9PEZI|nr:hypothetical protein K402DRAFT_19390 [Aulographum hederae CBS 113979]
MGYSITSPLREHYGDAAHEGTLSAAFRVEQTNIIMTTVPFLWPFVLEQWNSKVLPSYQGSDPHARKCHAWVWTGLWCSSLICIVFSKIQLWATIPTRLEAFFIWKFSAMGSIPLTSFFLFFNQHFEYKLEVFYPVLFGSCFLVVVLVLDLRISSTDIDCILRLQVQSASRIGTSCTIIPVAYNKFLNPPDETCTLKFRLPIPESSVSLKDLDQGAALAVAAVNFLYEARHGILFVWRLGREYVWPPERPSETEVATLLEEGLAGVELEDLPTEESPLPQRLASTGYEEMHMQEEVSTAGEPRRILVDSSDSGGTARTIS